MTAHAYLFYPDARELTPEARARLATLADHTELGAGFAIAMRDLEIRGAGDLLGAEQSGHVAARRLRALRRAAARGGRRALGPAARRGAPGARRRARRRLRAGRATSAPRRSRSTSTAGSRSPRPRTSCASSTRRSRTATARPRAGREPVRDPGGEAQARAARRRLPRLPRRPAHRSGRSCSAPASCRSSAAAIDTAVYTTANVKLR